MKATVPNLAVRFTEEHTVLFRDFINYGNLVLRDLLRWGKRTPKFSVMTVSLEALGTTRPCFQEQSGNIVGRLLPSPVVTGLTEKSIQASE